MLAGMIIKVSGTEYMSAGTIERCSLKVTRVKYPVGMYERSVGPDGRTTSVKLLYPILGFKTADT